jgi:hypothetical protein
MLEEVTVTRVDEDFLRAVDEVSVAVVFARALPDEPVEALDDLHTSFPFFRGFPRLFKNAQMQGALKRGKLRSYEERKLGVDGGILLVRSSSLLIFRCSLA